VLCLWQPPVAEVRTEIVLELLVGRGSTLVLTKVLLQSWHYERLDELVRSLRVAIDGPLHRAGSPPRATHMLQGRKEC
jgi:hypothetical protein